MKISLLILAAALLALPLLAQTRPVPVSPSANYEVSARNLDSRTWQRRETKMVNGRAVRQTNSFVELATGLSKWDSHLGQVVDCDPTIAIEGKTRSSPERGIRR